MAPGRDIFLWEHQSKRILIYHFIHHTLKKKNQTNIHIQLFKEIKYESRSIEQNKPAIKNRINKPNIGKRLTQKTCQSKKEKKN